MKVKDAQIDGFGVWTGLSVDSLPDGMTLFYGPNEAGKTTLMQFLRAMLYGFTPERRERYLPPIHGGTPGGAIRVTGPGGGYELRRRAQLTDVDGSGALTVTGTDGLVQGEHRLKMLLGQIDEPIFKNVFAIGLRELQELGTLDDTSAADELYKLSSGLDRVSLVDVSRQLGSARKEVVGSERSNRAGNQLADLIERRDRLRDEVDQLTRRGSRWSELAAQRRTQIQEIELLRDKLRGWEHDAKVVEMAINVRETWLKRQDLREKIERLERGLDLPDDAPMQLVHIDAQVDDRKSKLEDVRKQRRELRETANSLPLSQRLMTLQSRIEAASQQVTWIEALRDQIEKLDKQVDRAKHQVHVDAERIGLDEEERVALLDGKSKDMPDLSRATLSALGGPARSVKEYGFKVKQAREESLKDKQAIEQLERELRESLDIQQGEDLHEAIKEQGALIASFRQAIQAEEHLDKLKRHYSDLENDAISLTTSEALPIDRSILLSVPFMFGGVAMIVGMFKVNGWWGFNTDPDGMYYMLLGMFALVVWYLGRQQFDRGTMLDLNDTERQIDVIRKQMRETEREHDEHLRDLPSGAGSLESRLRDSLGDLKRLEDALPLYHNHQATLQRYKSARKRGADAADGLKRARTEWKRSLQRLGLSESLSPKSIRDMSDGYETVQTSLKRLEEVREEREERQRELAVLARRVESLYREAMGDDETNADRSSTRRRGSDDPTAALSSSRADSDDAIQAVKDFINDDDEEFEESKRTSEALVRSERFHRKMPTDPLDQLNHMIEELERQQHWIRKRKQLKDQDSSLRKQSNGHSRAIERYEQNRRSLWAKCGVATQEQFYELVDRKSALSEMRNQLEETQTKVISLIGTKLDQDEISHELESYQGEELEKRWESLNAKIEQTRDRTGALQTRQGELTAEMKLLTEDHRLTEAQLELGCIEQQMQNCVEHWQTLGMTSKLLEEVCATFEKERQPETLREASSFLNQLTDGKYTRIWTPLGTNRLNVDNRDDKALPIEVLSRGTREAVFIALRLALAAAYARRGVMLPLVLDDVLVNFDRERAIHAVRTLQNFSELGHQVMMFTCHEHIVEIFHEVGAEVRLLPPQGVSGYAEVLLPEAAEEVEEEYEEEIVEELEEEVAEEEPEEEIIEEVIEEIISEEPEPEPEPIVEEIYEEVVEEEEPEPAPILTKVDRRRRRPVIVEQPASIDWMWFETDAVHNVTEVPAEQSAAPSDVWERDDSWWENQHQADFTDALSDQDDE